jgi:tetratricopeptide (TPR) repeat protein
MMQLSSFARRSIHMLPRLLILLGLSAVLLTAADLRALLDEATAAEARLDSARALELFLQADATKPDDAFILQKIAKQYSDLVPDQTTKEAKKDYARRALAFAQRSFALEPTNAVHALSLAICHGHIAVVSDVRTKVEMSRVIKEDAERALRLDPNYAWAHHILGRWHYEVAGLNGVARFFAGLFYGGIPPASFDEGITHLRRATELAPGELNHWIDLGFAYQAAGLVTEARAAWERGLAMPDRSKHDPVAKRRARDALANL